jgi:desulfoferrodoxin-like iron-binding protein
MSTQRARRAPRSMLGVTFRCSVCGAETIVIRTGNGALRPICCNQPMDRLEKRASMFRCPVCGSELAVIRVKTGGLRLICCNVPMREMTAASLANP